MYSFLGNHWRILHHDEGVTKKEEALWSYAGQGKREFPRYWWRTVPGGQLWGRPRNQLVEVRAQHWGLQEEFLQEVLIINRFEMLKNKNKNKNKKHWINWFAELLEIWKDLDVYRKQSKCKIGRNNQPQEEENIEKKKCNLDSLLGSVVNNVYCL